MYLVCLCEHLVWTCLSKEGCYVVYFYSAFWVGLVETQHFSGALSSSPQPNFTELSQAVPKKRQIAKILCTANDEDGHAVQYLNSSHLSLRPKHYKLCKIAKGTSDFLKVSLASYSQIQVKIKLMIKF